MISSSVPSAAQSSSQARKRTTALPSRRWAARAPTISASVLIDFGRMQGSCPRAIDFAAEFGFEPEGGCLGIKAHALALRFERRQPLGKRARRQTAWRPAPRARAFRGRISRGFDEEFGLAASGHDREGEHHGIVRDVVAANVEEPADRVGQRQDGGALAVALEPRLNLCDLFSGRLAGERERLGDDRAGGWFRLILAPQGIDRILRKGLELDALQPRGPL